LQVRQFENHEVTLDEDGRPIELGRGAMGSPTGALISPRAALPGPVLGVADFPDREESSLPLENFFESLTTAIRYVRLVGNLWVDVAVRLPAALAVTAGPI
jgi:hypothetical protein